MEKPDNYTDLIRDTLDLLRNLRDPVAAVGLTSDAAGNVPAVDAIDAILNRADILLERYLNNGQSA